MSTDGGKTFSRDGGHWVTVTGAGFNDNNNNGNFDAGDTPDNLSFIDPFGTDTTTVNGAITVNAANLTTQTTQFSATPFLDVSNFFTEVNNPAWNPMTDANTYVLIDGFVAESPIPEPGTLSLMIVALVGFGATWRRMAARPEGR